MHSVIYIRRQGQLDIFFGIRRLMDVFYCDEYSFEGTTEITISHSWKLTQRLRHETRPLWSMIGIRSGTSPSPLFFSHVGCLTKLSLPRIPRASGDCHYRQVEWTRPRQIIMIVWRPASSTIDLRSTSALHMMYLRTLWRERKIAKNAPWVSLIAYMIF